MKLEELVPNIELCKLIPDGEFADSAFYWFEELQKINEKPPHDYRYFVNFSDFHGYGWGGGRCCPAPTVQEIFTRLPNMYALNGDFLNPRMFITLRNKEIKKHGLIIPDAALKIWFLVRGINYEQPEFTEDVFCEACGRRISYGTFCVGCDPNSEWNRR